MSARINISVPDELKARMDAEGDGTNWSQVASEAFEDHLERRRAIDVEAWLESLRERVDSIVEAECPSGDPVETCIRMYEEYARALSPRLASEVRDKMGPILRDAFERRKGFDLKMQIPWPIGSADELGLVIAKAIQQYHDQAVTPLSKELLLQTTLFHFNAIIDRA